MSVTLPAQIEYAIRQLVDRNNNIYQRQNYYFQLVDINNEVKKYIDQFQLEFAQAQEARNRKK